MDSKAMTRRLRIVELFRTQERFAIEAKINEGTVSKIVRGLKEPTFKQKKTFSKLLKLSESELF